MTHADFVHLHNHTQYSLLEASARSKDLVAAAKAMGQTALAITDSGNLYGAVEFYSACKDAGIKPIIGVELAVVEGDITDRNTRKPTHTVVLLCQNQTGYRNLCQLVSTAHMEGFYFRPRINWELLEAHNEGLICLTDNLYGPIGYHILRGHYEHARDRVVWLKRVFGERLFLEMQYHGLSPEVQVSAAVARLSNELDVPMVITNDTRFTRQGQETAVDILLCMQQGKTIHEPRNKTFGPEYYLKSAEEMAASFPHVDRDVVERAMANTVQVAEMVDFHWPMGESILPQFPLPEGQTEPDYLRQLVERYTAEKYAPQTGEIPPHVRERMDLELNVINQMGFPAYFLIVWDFIDYARQKGIPVGPGRGSAAGSLVAYVLGITNIDPIEHNLLFERFLNPERISMPDIDIDFCIERRADVIDYVSQRYGRERVCQIATFGTLAAKAAVKAVARVLDIAYAESDRIAKMIPGVPGTKLKDAMAEGTDLAKEYESNEQVKQWLDLALLLEGTACNVGTHAAGVVISKDPLTQVIALQNSKDGQVISQCTMGDLEKLGLLKMDFLGLRNLTIIHNTLNLVKKYQGVELDLDDPPLDDDKVYSLLSAGDTDGVFQLESSGMKALVRDLRPSTFEDINALVALYRPGPLNSGMVKTFVDRKHGRAKVEYPHEALKGILEPTYGTIVYQEQIMQVAQILGGYSLGQADLLRRAMGKKKAEVMEKERVNFIAGCQAKGLIEDDPANALFDTMTEFAAYCFNRSHSAAYAFVAFQTAYLKAHYPVEYLSALLSSVRDNLDKLQHYLMAGRRMGIQILPPDVNTSDLDFTPSDGAIRFGLASIKNVGVGVVETIVTARETGGRFTSLEDFISRVDSKVLNRKTLESLIYSGALGEFGHSRKQLLENVETMADFAQRRAEQAITGQASLFDLLGGGGGGTGGFGGLMLSGNPTDELPDDELQRQEKALLGFYVSSHPLDSVAEVLPLVTQQTIAQLKDLPNDTEVTVGGLVSSSGRRMSKKGKPLIIGSLEDLTGQAEFLTFGEAVETYADVLAEGQRIILKARLSVRGDDDGTFTLIVNSVKPLTDVQPCVINLTQPPNFQQVHYLGEILKQHRGDCPVIFRLPDGTRIKVSPNFWVNRQQIPTVSHAMNQALEGIQLTA